MPLHRLSKPHSREMTLFHSGPFQLVDELEQLPVLASHTRILFLQPRINSGTLTGFRKGQLLIGDLLEKTEEGQGTLVIPIQMGLETLCDFLGAPPSFSRKTLHCY